MQHAEQQHVRAVQEVQKQLVVVQQELVKANQRAEAAAAVSQKLMAGTGPEGSGSQSAPDGELNGSQQHLSIHQTSQQRTLTSTSANMRLGSSHEQWTSHVVGTCSHTCAFHTSQSDRHELLVMLEAQSLQIERLMRGHYPALAPSDSSEFPEQLAAAWKQVELQHEETKLLREQLKLVKGQAAAGALPVTVELQQELFDARRQIADLSAQIDQLTRRTDSQVTESDALALKSLETIDTLERELAQAKAALTSAQSGHRRVASQADAVERAVELNSALENATKTAHREMEAQRAHHAAEVQQLQSDLSLAVQEISTLRSTTEPLQRANTDLHAQLAAQSDELARTKDTLQAYTHHLEQTVPAADLQRVNEDSARTRSALQFASQRSEQLEATLREREQQVKALSAALQMATQKSEQLEATLAEKERQSRTMIAELQQRITALQASASGSSSKSVDTEKVLAEKEKQHAQAMGQLKTQHQAEIKALSVQFHQLTAAMSDGAADEPAPRTPRQPLAVNGSPTSSATNGVASSPQAFAAGREHLSTLLETLNAENSSPAAFLLDFLLIVGRCKSEKRTGWVNERVPLPESIADHQYRMAIMAMTCVDYDALGGVESCASQSPTTFPSSKIDPFRAVQMALVHDLAEALVGDITPTQFSGVTKEAKHAMEQEAMDTICSTLRRAFPAKNPSAPHIADHLRDLYGEYEGGSTPTAKWLKNLDKVDMYLQAYEYQVRASGNDPSALGMKDRDLVKRLERFYSSEAETKEKISVQDSAAVSAGAQGKPQHLLQEVITELQRRRAKMTIAEGVASPTDRNLDEY